MPLYFSNSTWRVLGLSVAASYTGLGLVQVLLPHRAAAEFYALPSPSPVAQTKDDTFEDTAQPGSKEVSILVPLLGVRDLSVAAAIWAFAYQGKWREVGTVILAGTILCAADCAVVWRRIGPGLGAQFAVGAVSWTVIGAVLFWS
ncbi:hypothetical protein B0T16DRAFT_408366 [Cercophora newfieldiana]|uniref:Uncharacterized protein n=1 Tax=Cercophora newfieldiana TaxID=92897 RepID=A0AA40CRG4_9PEZI|nr:hypothetical protein B0T16DRAFT_408366 [Cercophora newfieldiana]